MDEFPPHLSNLPGADIVAAGLTDFGAGLVTVNSCLVALIVPHLGRAGIVVDGLGELIPEPERTLYRLLGQDGSGLDPYPRYNAFKRRIVSFARALAARRRALELRVGEVVPLGE